jgi:ParB family chromosome partitioning protein
MSEQLVQLKPEQIALPELQIRHASDSETIEALKESIRTLGLLQPIVVRRKGDAYELVAGRQRLRAVIELGWETVPARVLELSDEDALVAQAVENVNRRDVSPLEEAEYFAELRERTGWSTAEIARRIGRPESYVRERLQLLSAPEELLRAVADGAIPFRAARYLRQIDDPVTLSTYIAFARQGGINEDTARRWLEDYRRQKELQQALESHEPQPQGYYDPAALTTPSTPRDVTFECAICRQMHPIREAHTLIVCESCNEELLRVQAEDEQQPPDTESVSQQPE